MAPAFSLGVRTTRAIGSLTTETKHSEERFTMMYHVSTNRGFNLYQVPAESLSEAMDKVDRLAYALGINDFSIDGEVNDDPTLETDFSGANWDESIAHLVDVE